MRMLLEIGPDAGLERTEAFVRGKLARKEKISGFGHRVYHTEDPRATHLRRLSKALGEKAGQPHWFAMTERIEQIVRAEKKLYANVDLYSASMFYALGIPIDLYTPIFAVSRISGLDRARPRAVRQQPPDPPAHRLHRADVPADVPETRPAVASPREPRELARARS